MANCSQTVCFIKKCLIKVTEIMYVKVQDFNNVSLSRNTGVRRIEDLSANVKLQLTDEACAFDFYSKACDESTDATDTAQLLLFLRGVDDNFCCTEEMLDMMSLKGTTTGRDIFEAVSEAVEKMGLKWDKLCGVTTDGAPALMGDRKGMASMVCAKIFCGGAGPTSQGDGGICKKKWENLKQKYKDLKCPQTGVSTEDGGATAASWKWYTAMDEAIGGRPSITPPALVASCGPDVAVASSSSSSSSSSVRPEPARARKRVKDLEDLIQEMEEREEKRERKATEREERLWRGMEEKEDRRERERREKDERQEREGE
ncbi:uncharacterized protein LOC143742407 [Siphateles boraxobius]|uniref:uncharacterized protein LOC143742407 n=1 Tax=Siphateles boraxobius TaxID=180520 RepID=UPI0040646BA8